MKKKIVLIGFIAVLLFVQLTGCSIIEGVNNKRYTSPDGTFSITVETLVRWKEYKEVENRIDLMEDGKDNAITIERISKEEADYASYADITEFGERYMENVNVLEFTVGNGDLELSNDLFIEVKIYELLMSHEGKDYYGYLEFVTTEEDIFIILISGSNKNIVENYKEVANTLELN
jgi:hypothetical protein